MISRSERIAQWIVRCAAAIAPHGWRAEFAREWEAELAERFRPDVEAARPTGAQSVRLIYRSLLSVVDALHLRAQEFTVDSLTRDLRFAARSLLRRPGFTALTVATIALGIGANTAIFTVVNSVLLQPLPYPEPDELVMVWEQDRVRGWERVPGNAEDYLAWEESAESFSAIGGVVNATFALTGDQSPERIPGARVTSSLFDVFDVAPLLGVPFGPEANVAGQDRQIVLSHGLWERRFGSDPAVIGTTLDLDGSPFEVVAVMPESFQFPSTAQMWAPLVFSEAQLQDRNWHFLLTIARLAPGTSVTEAQAETETIAARLGQEFPESNADYGLTVMPLHSEMTNAVRSMLWVLLGAVGFVLLIACANVANLLLVRASGRSRELSVRAALGAGKSRLIRQLLTESLLLALVGGVLGLGVAFVGLDAMLALSPLTVPGGGTVSIDGWVLGATAIGTLLTGIVFGLAPVTSVLRTDLQGTLREARGQTGGGNRRLRSGLVVTEIALALVLVTGAGLMVQSVRQMLDVDVGMNTGDVLLAQFSLPAAAYPQPEEQVLFYDQLIETAGAIPGVVSASLSTIVPPASGGQYHVRVEGVHEAWTMDLPVARTRAVSHDYLQAMGVPLIRGRYLEETDVSDAPFVVVVDQAFVDSHFPGEDPIGRQIRTLLDTPREIVGVVGNVTNSGLVNQAGPTTYFPYRQHAFGGGQTLLLRTTGEPELFVRAMQEAIWNLDPNLPITGVGSLEERLADSVSQSRFNAVLLSLFAVLALSLASVGIYGVMAYTVNERTSELGLRMALGASAVDVRGLVLRQAAVLAVGGVVLGTLASLGLTRVIESFLYEVEPTDPITISVVAVGLCGVALVASLVPAVRASRLDPLRALRE